MLASIINNIFRVFYSFTDLCRNSICCCFFFLSLRFLSIIYYFVRATILVFIRIYSVVILGEAVIFIASYISTFLIIAFVSDAALSERMYEINRRSILYIKRYFHSPASSSAM